jgi:hypothetical protein
MLSLLNAEQTSSILQDIADANRWLREYDKHSYPHEAHHVAAIATGLKALRMRPILEADYWFAVEHERGTTKPRVDIWCPESADSQELWVEVKIAALRTDRPKDVGMRPASRAVASWADDVYRLAALACNSQEAGIRCALVISHFGTSRWKPEPKRSAALPATRTDDADELWAALRVTNPAGSSLGALDEFLGFCKDALPDCSVHTTSLHQDGQFYGLTSVEWTQRVRMRSQYAVKWTGR